MNSRPPSFDKLIKILKLEIDTGYRDRAMIGGLSQFALKWQDEAQRESDDAARVATIVERLRAYSTLGEGDARRQSIEEILNRLNPSSVGGSTADQALDQTPAPSVPTQIERSPAVAEPAVQEQPAAPSVAAEARAETPRPEPAAPPPAPAPPPRPAPASSARPPEPRLHRDERANLQSPVTALSGVGPANAEKLARLGVKTIRDLLWLLPRRYDDFSALKPINRLEFGDEVTVIGSVWEAGLRRTRGGAQLFQALLSDGSGMIQCTWFNPYLNDKIKRGQQIVVSGRVDEYLGRLTFQSPEWEHLEKELLHTARLVPIYPLTEGITNRWLRKLTRRVVDYWAPHLSDFLPDALLLSAGLISAPKAIAQAHFPDSPQQLESARKRLAFDELFLLQLGMLRQRQQWKAQSGRALELDPALLEIFLNSLPYALTAAQRRTLDDVIQDARAGQPMNRLIQGDVGSGKTIVAAAAMFLITQAGAQAAIMAPTEILAEQHFKNFAQVFAGLQPDRLKQPIAIRLLTGSTPQAEREEIRSGLAGGAVNILIGTHALIQQGVDFRDLALVVIDEQHRFGVAQRAALRQKGIRKDEGGRLRAEENFSPHVLVMTATPIPRTLALTLYGDLDLSVIDEMPPGRQPIQTRLVLPTERERMYSFVRAQIEKGRQAYIICPLVEESEKIEAKAAVEEHERLQKHIFPQLQLGLLHGRMKPDEKEAVMRAFSAGELHILVSTSVVEVGIDVPNATVMLIEGAQRFGLSQLHQFRGRVGRGVEKSYCLLLADSTTNGLNERLRAVESTQDGFALAEKDLELRGPGEFFGTRQSGLPDMRTSGLADARLIELARREAEKLIAADPDLQAPDHTALAQRMHAFWSSGEGDLS
ncbi:MAG TPA: ATP-dependent DNA helicase RecG [Anaerolineae bacterium]|nr:ATP-dependent DNA helicase RecG [Anaerolineae bacterium]